jgi:anti-sigma factor RsiW
VNTIITGKRRKSADSALCNRIRARLSGFLLRELPTVEIRDVEAHLAACPACLAATARGRSMLAFLVVDGTLRVARRISKRDSRTGR